jgi:methylated-DNA-[protein]-cysteine S-methyltransferase
MSNTKKRSPTIGTVKTPNGKVLIAIGPRGIIKVGGVIERTDLDKMASCGPKVTRVLVRTIREIQEYCKGKRRKFSVKVDLSSGTPFQQKVWRELLKIPYGHVITYAELAKRAGNPGAVRAVGNAVGSNPIGIIVPCHRVVASGGRIGGWSGGGGIAGKRALLKLEGSDTFKMEKTKRTKK